MGRCGRTMNKEYGFIGKKQIVILLVLLLLGGLGGGSAYLTIGFHVNSVEVKGNQHYTDQEIEDMVLKGGMWDNSLLLKLQYRNKEIEDVPFVESMEVTIVDRHSISIQVYEKALAGCVEYLDRFMYFDREGVIVESSEQFTKGIPQVTGLKFDEIRLYEALPVEDATIFSDILTITQLLGKYKVIADKIHFERNGNVMLYCGDVRVNLGKNGQLDEKIMELPNILPNLEGKKGVLQMQDYDGNSEEVTFELE